MIALVAQTQQLAAEAINPRHLWMRGIISKPSFV
jgi:hypothetical protein